MGLLLIDKPLGPTSHDLVGWARWGLRERSVGHCGTLDPAASGLMVLCVGEATKLVEHLTAVDKRYRARFVLGASTTTADAAGEIVEQAAVTAEVEARACEVLAAMLGDMALPPPIYSAVKLQGRRAHELARAGEIEQLPPRAMAVRSVEIHDAGRDGERVWIDASVHVAKGTYVRSLAEELGRRLGVPGHLGALHRTACGSLSLDDPQAIAGLAARALENTKPGAKPRWRIDTGEVDGEEDRREAAARCLERGLIEPWKRLPFAVSELPVSGVHEPLVARLGQGQRLSADPATLAHLGLEGICAGTCALVEPHAGRMIILEHEPAAVRLAPRRVLSFAPTGAPRGIDSGAFEHETPPLEKSSNA